MCCCCFGRTRPSRNYIITCTARDQLQNTVRRSTILDLVDIGHQSCIVAALRKSLSFQEIQNCRLHNDRCSDSILPGLSNYLLC